MIYSFLLFFPCFYHQNPLVSPTQTSSPLVPRKDTASASVASTPSSSRKHPLDSASATPNTLRKYLLEGVSATPGSSRNYPLDGAIVAATPGSSRNYPLDAATVAGTPNNSRKYPSDSASANSSRIFPLESGTGSLKRHAPGASPSLEYILSPIINSTTLHQ